MPESIDSLLRTGTWLWLDSVDPDLTHKVRAWGGTGATSNPVIIKDLIATGRFDDRFKAEMAKSDRDDDIAWAMTDRLVRDAQAVFRDVYRQSGGNDGYVSFELDPLLEDPDANLAAEDQAAKYVELGQRWYEGHDNRMIKVPATPGGILALEELAASGIPLNVTLIFTKRQYEAARDAVWRGAQRLKDLSRFKSVYSVFVSRVDIYTQKHVPDLSPAAQGQVGIVGAKEVWRANRRFWQEHKTPLDQQIIFASTGVKTKGEPPEKYVRAFAGSDIQTNPPETIEAVAAAPLTFDRLIDQLPPGEVLDEIRDKVDVAKMEDVLVAEGIGKFAKPQHDLLALIGQHREQLQTS